jgi:hypothetical protein
MSDEPTACKIVAAALNHPEVTSDDGKPKEKYVAHRGGFDREGYPECVHELLADPGKLARLRRDAEACKKWMRKFLDHIDVSPSPSQREWLRYPEECKHYVSAEREYLRELFSNPEECRRYVNEVLFPSPTERHRDD